MGLREHYHRTAIPPAMTNMRVYNILTESSTADPRVYKGRFIKDDSPRQLSYCIDCLVPRPRKGCNGPLETDDRPCEAHSALSGPVHSDAGASPALNVDDYELIRDQLQRDRMILQLSFTRARLAMDWTRTREAMARVAQDEQFEDRAREEYYSVEKYHSNGCLRSDTPEVVIFGNERREGSTKTRTSGADGQASRLATGLYFRRCFFGWGNLAGDHLDRDTA